MSSSAAAYAAEARHEARPTAHVAEITLQDLTLDETMDDLQKIQKCCTSVVPVSCFFYAPPPLQTRGPQFHSPAPPTSRLSRFSASCM
jgi:hypothetical protein